jgi:outer membrane protein assembly factor BamE
VGTELRNRRILIRALLLVALALSAGTGCVYRMNIQQGNLLEQSAVDQVQEGMTRSQVQFLLGTPTISDPFRRDRWDYPFYFRQGRNRQVIQHWFVVFFEDDRVIRMERRIDPRGERAAEQAS